MKTLRGSITALVTPFKDGQVDEDAFRGFVNWQIEEGTHGLVPVGTTGESPTLSHDEHERVVEICVEEAKGPRAGHRRRRLEQHRRGDRPSRAMPRRRAPTRVLVVTPYYNKPTQEGLYQHYKAINDAIGIPIVIYNIPGRSVIDMSVETMARLFELKNIVGVKDATANIARASLQRQAMGPDFIQLSGEDATALGFMAHGGHGCISVTSNVAPRLCSEFQEACLDGRLRQRPDAPGPADAAAHGALHRDEPVAGRNMPLSVLGRMTDEVRLPMVPVSEPARKQAVALGHGPCRADQR